MKVLPLIILSVLLNHCFLIPRLQIRRAISSKDCQSLSQKLLYDLQKKDFEKSIPLCLKNKKYKETLLLVSELEKKDLKEEEKRNLRIQKFDLYHNHLFDYKNSIAELKKILKEDPNQTKYIKRLIQAYLKNNQLQEALKISNQTLLSKKLSKKSELEFQFIQARLLMLNQQRSQALKIFKKIKNKDFEFFKNNEGPFYTALLLEETQRFDEAIEALEQADWIFSSEKRKHWMYRKKNTP